MSDDVPDGPRAPRSSSGGGSLEPRRFRQLVEGHGRMLEVRAQRFPRLTPEQAEDLVNDVWVYALVKLEKVLQHPKPGAWLLVVMGHRYLDYLRSTRPGPFTTEDMERLVAEDQR